VKARMMKKNLNSFATFALLSLILVSMVSMVTLPLANAANHLDEDKAGEEKGQTSMAKGFQGNLCDFSDSACIQATEDQSASGSDNKAIGFNDQSDNAAPSGDKKATTTGNTTDILMKIDGIDHSTVKVKVWVTADNGREISKTFNPVPLLNPEDDDRGLILLPMKVEKGLLDIGDTYTACIKVIQDTDKYGNKQSCQQGALTLEGTQEVSNSINPAAADTAADAGGDSAGGSGYNGNGVPVMRISL
jgi:hypothetical protein